MRLTKVRLQKYRSIRDTGYFDIETAKTILVGPNEAGKTALLQALQQLNPPPGVRKFDTLRDYPRSEYNDITTKKVDPANVTVVEGHFVLEAEDQALLSEEFKSCVFVSGTKLNNERWHRLEGATAIPKFADIKKDLACLCSHIDSRSPTAEDGQPPIPKPSADLDPITKDWVDHNPISQDYGKALKQWLSAILQYVEEGNATEEERHERLVGACTVAEARANALAILAKRMPVFVLFSNPS
jgi:energy-coupling factor transporter ATP-binding protein EcfA2